MEKKHNQALQHRSLKDISRGAFAPGLCQIINDLAKVFCSLLVNFGGQHSGETNTPNSWLCRPLNARHEEDLQPVRVPRRHPGFCTNSAAAINIYIYICVLSIYIIFFKSILYTVYITTYLFTLCLSLSLFLKPLQFFFEQALKLKIQVADCVKLNSKSWSWPRFLLFASRASQLAPMSSLKKT